jgi:hypothetical protein
VVLSQRVAQLSLYALVHLHIKYFSTIRCRRVP